MPLEGDLEEGQTYADPGLRRILLIARREWCWLVLGLVMLFASSVPMLVMPLFFGKLIDDIQRDSYTIGYHKDAVDRHLTELLTILFVGMFANITRAFVFNGVGERVVARLRIQLFRAIMQQEIAMFDRRKTGELLSRLTADTTTLQDVVTANVSMLFRGGAQLVCSLSLMFVTSPQLATVVISVVPVCIIAIAMYSRVLKKLSTRYTDALGAASEVAQQAIANIRTVRSFAAEDVEARRYEKALGDPDAGRACCWYPRASSSYKAGIQKQIANAFFIGFVTVVGGTAVVGVIWYGAYCVIDGIISVGSLITFMLYSVQIAASLGMLAGLVASLFQAKGASKRTFQLIDRRPRVPLTGGAMPEQMDGFIRFENVSFAYPTRPDIYVLRHFTIDIPRDATVAFVGASGAGKSTLLLLIQRFYGITSGRILIDNIPLEALDPSWVRRHFAFVSQEPALFSASFSHNIAYGYAGRMGSHGAVPSQDSIERAARSAYAHDLISHLPHGYNTIVGERGVRLSLDQKRRVAIARALFMNPRVLLLDEATAGLDAESEVAILRAIERAMTGRTTLIVAQRISTVRNADQIVVIDHGSIVDADTHSDLLRRCDKYQALVNQQLAGNDDASSDNLSSSQ